MAKSKPLLTAGDTVTIIAPSGSLTKERLIAPIQYLNAQGLTVKLGKHLLKRDRYLAGSIQERLEDLHTAFLEKGIKAIFIARGGFGCTQLLPHLNYSLIKKNRKPFFGLSDTTALQIALFQKAKLPSITGLSLCSDFTPKGSNHFTRTHLEQFIHTSEFPIVTLTSQTKYPEIKGILIGGCLSLIVSLAGTPHQIQLKDKILFLEDVREEPYRIDRMLTQLSQQKDFNTLKAIVFGQFFKCTAENKKHGTLNKVIEKFRTSIAIPTFTDLLYGHQPNRYQLPIGLPATITPQNQLIITPYHP